MQSATSRSVRAIVGFAILAGIAAVGRTAEIDLASPRIIISAGQCDGETDGPGIVPLPRPSDRQTIHH